jgi:hypothetical protein
MFLFLRESQRMPPSADSDLVFAGCLEMRVILPYGLFLRDDCGSQVQSNQQLTENLGRFAIPRQVKCVIFQGNSENGEEE